MTQPQRSSALRTAVLVVAVVVLMYLAKEVLIPLAFAITVSLVLSPAVSFVQKLLVRRFPAALAVMVFALTVSGAVGYVIFNQVLQVVNDLPSYRQNIQHKIRALRRPDAGSLARAAQNVKEISKELANPEPQPRPTRQPTVANPMPVQVVEPPSNDIASLSGLMHPFWGALAIVLMVIVFAVFLLVEESDLRNRMFRLAGLSRLNLVTQAVEDATQRISRYLMLQVLVNIGYGLVAGTGLYLIGVPYAVLWGTVAGLLRVVPYVGPLVGGLLPLILSLAVFDEWRAPLMVLGLFMTMELITGNFLEPYLYGAHTGISSLALLVATVFWTALWGPAGLILSTPLTVCVVVLGRHVPHLSFLHVLLGDEPVLAPEARFYQRLLAMDEKEARAVAETYRHENNLLLLYDSLILPALTLAEQDRHKGALDPEREEFLFLSVREMMMEFSEKELESDSATPPARSTTPGRFLCVPAHDEADEIASVMLAQLLEAAGCATVALPLATSVQSMLEILEPSENDVLVISAVPPFAFAHARTMNRQLRTRFPKPRIVVGIWGYRGDAERALKRFEPSPPTQLVGSFSEVLQVFGLIEPPAPVPVPAAAA
ncbi:MAG: AI-2E family transporter [Bryobacteraceae bacterium]